VWMRSSRLLPAGGNRDYKWCNKRSLGMLAKVTGLWLFSCKLWQLLKAARVVCVKVCMCQRFLRS
jgi:hypothetical protein